MDKILEDLLAAVAEWDEKGYEGAFNIRANGKSEGRRSSANIKILPREAGDGLKINIAPGTKDERVYIPACITHGDFTDVVYNDFYVGEGADVVIVAGCGVHSDGEGEAMHNGIHSFFLEKGARVVYEEKHLGTGTGVGQRVISPQTVVNLGEDSYLEMNTQQLGGVDNTERVTRGTVGKNARLVVHESIMTDGVQKAKTEFDIAMDGEDSSVDLISRSVAKDDSYQSYHSKISGNNRCKGHSECDAILVGNGKVNAAPELFAGDLDAALVHEAAIGKVAGEQILKLQTLGLTEKEAEERIIQGFLEP